MYDSLPTCEPINDPNCVESRCQDTLQTIQCKTRESLLNANEIANSLINNMFAVKSETTEISVNSMETSLMNICDLSYQLNNKLKLIATKCFDGN